MIKIIETPYTREALEKIMNKKGETLVGLMNGLIISKVTVTTSRQLVAKTETQKFFDMYTNKTPNLEIIAEIEQTLKASYEDIKLELFKFANWYLEKGENSKKCKWEKFNTFEYKSRLVTWFANKKPDNLKPKKDIGVQARI